MLDHYGTGELQLLMPALARLSQPENREASGWIAWIAPPFEPYPPALSQWGVDLSRVLIVRPKDDGEALWAAEQALRAPACGALLLWCPEVGARALRRLQLAAETGGGLAMLFRNGHAVREPSPAALRLRLDPSADGLVLQVLKCRGRVQGRPIRVSLGG